MKKFLLGTAVLCAGLLSACQALEQAPVQVEEELESTVFTAYLATETKTYMDYDAEAKVYKNFWSASDNITIVGLDEDNNMISRQIAYLLSGENTNKAKFSAAIQADKYIAYYGYASNEGDAVTFKIQDFQSLRENGESYQDYFYPMYASGDDTNLTFKNLCSVLKLEISGNTYLDNVVFTPNNPEIYAAGFADLSLDGTGNPSLSIRPDSTASHSITYYIRKELVEDEVQNCYIVLPAQTYTDGFTLTFNGNEGSQTKVFTQDVTFERSQLRSISNISFTGKTPNVWSIIGTMTNWEEDYILEPCGDGGYGISGLAIRTSDQFKFRANGNWDLNFGSDLDVVSAPNTEVALRNGGWNIRLSEEGTYDIVLYPERYVAKITQVSRVISCENYEQLAGQTDGTLVRVKGFVLGINQNDFIFNISNQHRNCVLISPANSDYTPVLGNGLDIIAKKTTVNGLPKLVDIQQYKLVYDEEVDYGYGAYYNFITSDAFATTTPDRYDYIKIVGTLVHEASSWKLLIDGVDSRYVEIEAPVQDLSGFEGARVYVEGWYIGLYNECQFKIILTEIIASGADGSLEDIIPGDEIIEMPEI
ncbi:MAG: hypothetical protein ACI3ZF_05155 [Candidatus Cryptobacteroides sp.]